MEEGIDPNTSQTPSIGDLAPLFPAYQFERFIAEGGMGAVYLARQISLDRPVAIKILARGLGEDPVFRASFEAEAKAMARLNHPNLIGVFDFGEADDMLFIVMEMVDGKSLHDSAYGRTIDPLQAGSIVSSISRGLEHAHNAGILHRDIKPGNILLDSDAHPKIGDFGLAQPMDQKTSEEGQIYGTPGYTAPEVYDRKGDHRADIFSVGILLHELLVGKLPDGSGTPASMLCGCSRAFDSIITRATNPNPLARYQSAGELADDLDKAVLQVDAANASTNRLVLPAVAPVAVAGSARVSRVSAQARMQRNVQVQKAPSRAPTVTIVVVCAVLGVVLIGLLASSGSKDDDGGGDRESDRAEQARRAAEGTRDRNRDQGKVGENQGNADPKMASNGRPVTPEKVDPKTLAKPSPIAALKGLKTKLSSGARDEFPSGTEARDGSRFLLVDRPMNWWEAKAYAEEHGAHLAVLTADVDRKWFREKFPSDAPVWVGAGMASDNQWQWIDGSKWNAAGASPAGSEERQSLSIGVGGALQAESSWENFHIAMQWRDDGSNPATTRAQLERAGDTVKTRGVDNAIYPVGTRTYAELRSHFFLVPKAIAWDAARKMAKEVNGYLAVPSSRVESDWIRQRFGGGGAPDMTLWLGGYRLKPEEPWRWLTNEAWNNNSGWTGGEAPVGRSPGRLILQLGSEGTGWLPSDGADGGALGFLIEWSPPKQASTLAAFDLTTWLEKTDVAFTKRLQADIAAYNKDQSLLIDRYVRRIKLLGRKHLSALSGQDGSGKDRIRKAIRNAVREVENNEAIVAKISSSAPDDFHDLQKKTKNSVKELVDGFHKKLSRQVGVYTQGLGKKVTQLTQNGYDQAAAALTERSGSLNGDGAALLELMSLEDPTIGAIVEESEDEDKKDTK